MPYDFTSNPFALSDQVAELRATVAALTARAEMAEGERDKATERTATYERDWFDAKHEFGKAMKSARAWAALWKQAAKKSAKNILKAWLSAMHFKRKAERERDTLRARLQVVTEAARELCETAGEYHAPTFSVLAPTFSVLAPEYGSLGLKLGDALVKMRAVLAESESGR